MELRAVQRNGVTCAVVHSEELVMKDVESALEVLMHAKYDLGTGNVVISKELIVPEFFILSTGIAGEILQKYVTYGGRIGIYGDFSQYTSKPLKDFIYESNGGRDVFFADSEEDALCRLTR